MREPPHTAPEPSLELIDAGAGAAAVPLPAEAAERPHRLRFWRDARLRRLLALADVGATAMVLLFLATAPGSAIWLIAFLPLWIFLAKMLGLYDHDHRSIRHLTVDELPALLGWMAAVSAGTALLMGALTPHDEVSASTLALAWLAGVGAVVLLRAASRMIWRRLTPGEETIVIGDGELAAAVRRKLELFPDMHLALTEAAPEQTADENGWRHAARRWCSQADRLIIATDELEPERIAELAPVCRSHQVKLSVISPLRGPATAAARMSELGELSVLEYNTWDISRSTVLVKQVVDFGFALFSLVVFLPLLPFIALAIKLDSRGSVFFVQERAGLHGRPFRMFKFRTMVNGAHESRSDLVAIHELPEPVYKLLEDPRVTRVGRFLRRYSIDELPQVLNVLRGEMSIVGPRPEEVELVERYRPEHRFRLAVKPGITGPMQVSGRAGLSFGERLAVELRYVDNLSLAADLRILAQTVPVVLRGAGAF